PSTQARASCLLGSVIGAQGYDQLPRAEGLIQEGLEELPADAPFALDRVYCLHSGAFMAYLSGHYPEALARALPAQGALRQAPFQPALLELDNLTLLGMSYTELRRMRDALATFEQASELSRTQGLGNTQWAAEVFYRWGQALWEFGRPLEAEPMFNRYARIAQRGRADRVMSPAAMWIYGQVLVSLGRLDEAGNYAERLRTRTQSERYGNWGLWLRTFIYLRQGNLERAEQMLSEVELWDREHLASNRNSVLALQRARIASARGQKAAALDLANQA